jgi:hypothetical protein
MNSMMLQYFKEEPISVGNNGIKVTFGLRTANYNCFGKHILLPFDKKNIEKMLFSLTNKVLH